MAKKENICPMLKKRCIEHECAWFTRIRGNDNNTGQEVDHHACAIAWLPTLLIENSNQQRSTGSAVESFRNEMVQANHQSQRILAASIGVNLIENGE